MSARRAIRTSPSFLLAAVGCLVWAGGAAAQGGTGTATWTGTASTAWNNGANWSGTDPTANARLQFIFGAAANQNTNNNWTGLSADPQTSLANPAITFNTGGFTLA